MKESTAARMRPILFLDFDDVICLNKEGGYGGFDALDALGKMQKGEATAYDFQHIWDELFHRPATANLRRIHDEFKPVYVISSSWTKFMNKDAICAVLFHGGLDFVVGSLHADWETVKAASDQRAREIGLWVERHPEYSNNWVALDDKHSGTGFIDYDTGECKHAHVVLCDVDIGFTDYEYGLLREKMLKRLGGMEAKTLI
jgi:hypothetical protein